MDTWTISSAIDLSKFFPLRGGGQRPAFTSGRSRCASGRLVQCGLDRLLSQVTKWHSLTSAKGDSCLLDATQKFRVVLEPILEPILLRRKSDEDAGRTTVPCDQNLVVGREPQISGQVILHFRQRHDLCCFALACLLRRATTGLRPS